MNKTETVAPHPPLTDYYADEDRASSVAANDIQRQRGRLRPHRRLDGVRYRSLVSQAGASSRRVGAGHAGTRCRYRHRAHCDPGRAPHAVAGRT